ncbi:melanocortin receptor 4-like [Acropora muricata]|uniref:melanocortin receptor 4-like n=1 Tax=Acropora muricata TaxID=159855 RepID=UPI0034E3AB76
METFKPKFDFLWVIDQRPFFVFIFSFNVFLAFTATLGNTLILIALHKVSSIHPPTKFLLRCLAMTDFCVGVILRPLFVAFLMELASDNRLILYLTLSTLNFTFCGLSFATATVISVDRLLALLLGLRYRHTVTLRRVRCFVVCFSASYNCKWIYIFLVFSGRFQQRWICSYHNLFFPLCLLSRQNISQTATASSPSTGGIALDIERYKKIVCTMALVQLAFVFCYFPLFTFLILAQTTDWYKTGSIFHASALTVVYFNSTLNPILYCWKIREVREAVKTTVKQVRCLSS